MLVELLCRPLVQRQVDALADLLGGHLAAHRSEVQLFPKPVQGLERGYGWK